MAESPAGSPRADNLRSTPGQAAREGGRSASPAAREGGRSAPGAGRDDGGFERRAVVFSAEDLRRAQLRIAHEIVERNHGAEGIVLVGLHERGPEIAQRLAAAIATFEDVEVPVGALDVAFYRDDIGMRPVQPLGPTEIPVDVTGKVVVLVDDVLFTGRTIRAAMDALTELGRPRAIQLAVLVDRGHRELPIRADFVGKNLPTKVAEDVRVRLHEHDGADDVIELWGPSGPSERGGQGPSGPSERGGQGPSGPSERGGQGPSGPSEREGGAPTGEGGP